MNDGWSAGDKVRVTTGPKAKKYDGKVLTVAVDEWKTRKNPADFIGHKPDHVIVYTTWRHTVSAWIHRDHLERAE
jgi:hypothetical protein